MRIRWILSIIWLLLSFYFGHSQKFQYVIYNGEDVPFNSVNQVLEDSHSFVWLATDRGLFRFDGSNFEDHNTFLESRNIRSLADLNENSFLFSNDTGIYSVIYEGREVVIDPYLLSDESLNELEYPGELFLDSKKRLWIGQSDGSVYLHDESNDRSLKIRIKDRTKIHATYFAEDKFNTIWVLLPGEGLFYYDEIKNRFTEFGNFDSVSHFTILEDQILLAGNEVVQIQLNNKQQEIDREYLALKGPSFSYITVDKTGLIILASDQGLYSIDRDHKNQLNPIFGSNDPHRIEVLPFQDVNHIYFSSDQVRIGGKIWLCTPQGLGLMYAGFFKSVSGMAMDNTLSLGTTNRNDILVSQGNVFSIREIRGEYSFEEFETNDIRVTAITSSGPYNWIGSSEGTIFRVRDGVRRQFDISNRGGGIFYMYADSEGGVWFCQAPRDKPIIGLARIGNNGQITEYGLNSGINSRILVLDEGGKSELYVAGIGADSYLYKYDRKNDRFENKSLPFDFEVRRNFEVHDIAVDLRGIVWMATTDGLIKYDTERVHRVELGEHTKNEIRSVCTLADGSVWLATDTSGLIHLDVDGNYVLFGEHSGTPSKIASYRAMLLDKANHLWVGTAEGLVYSVMPFPAPLSTKKPFLRKLVVNARDLEPDNKIKFSSEDVVDLYFTSTVYPGDENQFQYKTYLSGLPKDEIEDIPWSHSEEQSRIRLTSQDPGSFLLAVRTRKPGGFGWSAPTTIPYIIQKPWYASWWGISLILFIVLLIFSYGIRFFSRKKTARLEFLLSNKEKELSAKEDLLISQESRMKTQEKALKTVGVNINLLYSLMYEVPENPKWEQVISILSKLVKLHTGIDGFEFAYVRKNNMNYMGYRRGSNVLVKRMTEFNEKENLSSYVISHKQPLLINNNTKEARQFIGQKDDLGYLSRIYVPIRQADGSEVILCIFAERENRFSQQDLTILQIFGTYLSAKVKDVL